MRKSGLFWKGDSLGFSSRFLVWGAMDLIETYSLNSVDAIVLCSALNIATELRNVGNTLVLVASDQRLLRAAHTEGLQTFNPERDSQQTLINWIS